mgnify:CR=1 FL=1
MRRKRRYVAFEVINSKNLDIHETAYSLRQSLGFDRPQLSPIIFDDKTQKGLFICSHGLVDRLRTAIIERGMPIKILGVSGTVRAVKRKFLSPIKK